MQLKMEGTFNAKLAKQLLHEENQFVSDILSKMPLSMIELEEKNENSDDEAPPMKKAKIFMGNEKSKRAQTFEELYEKFNELKGQKKLTHKQKQLKKGLKNRLKKKSKQEERMMQKKLARTEKNASGGVAIKTEEIEIPKVQRAKPVFNSEGHMVFSKFDFSDIGAKKKPLKTPKDPKKALEQIKNQKTKLRELVESGEKEKAVEIKEKEAWKNVLAKATGAKVKDDPELLKKSIKRDEQQKKRSAKKWESRLAGVEKAKQEKQQKRSENLLKRKKDKKTNKLKKASKKGRIIAGY